MFYSQDVFKTWLQNTFWVTIECWNLYCTISLQVLHCTDNSPNFFCVLKLKFSLNYLRLRYFLFIIIYNIFKCHKKFPWLVFFIGFVSKITFYHSPSKWDNLLVNAPCMRFGKFGLSDCFSAYEKILTGFYNDGL